jgi:hypothetical protein
MPMTQQPAPQPTQQSRPAQFVSEPAYTGMDSFQDQAGQSTSTQSYGYAPAYPSNALRQDSSMSHYNAFDGGSPVTPFGTFSHSQPATTYYLPPAATTSMNGIDPNLVTRQAPFGTPFGQAPDRSGTRKPFTLSIPPDSRIASPISTPPVSEVNATAPSAKGKENAKTPASQELSAWQRAWPAVKADLEPSHMSKAPLSTANKLVKLLSTFTEPSEQKSEVPVQGRKEVLMAIRQRGNDDFCGAWIAENSGRELLEVWFKEAVGTGKGPDGLEYRETLELVLKVGSRCCCCLGSSSFLRLCLRGRCFFAWCWIDKACLDARTLERKRKKNGG